MSDAEARYRELLRALPWRSRVKLAVGRLVRSAVAKVPGLRFIDLLFWKAKRGGWLGVFEPPFNISKQDRTVYDRRLRWHQWGVLSEDGGFRAYTPSSRSQRFATTAEAWAALEAAYWGKPSKTEWKLLR